MSKSIWGGLLTKVSPVVIALNLFLLAFPFLAWEPSKLETTQRIFFVYGVITLLALSLFFKPKRTLQFGLAGIFLIWSLIVMFLHAQIWDNSITLRYLNLYIMSEGFIHVLFGVVLYKLIYEYVDNLRSLPMVWIAAAGYLFTQVYRLHSPLSPLFAIVICSLIYLVSKRKWIILVIAVSCFVAFFNYQHWGLDFIRSKWSSRPQIWPLVIKEIIQHPIIGTGFDRGLPANMIEWHLGHYVFRQNDFLNITKDLGIPALIIILLFIKDFLMKFKVEILSCACLATLLIGFAQTNWYYPRFSVIAITFFALWRVKCEKV